LAQNLELVLDPGGAAFYGPKISVQARDAIGRTWQMSTIQVDFQLPQRFNLEYAAADGTKQQPVMIHRALFGSIERFFGVSQSTMREHSQHGWRQFKCAEFQLQKLSNLIWQVIKEFKNRVFAQKLILQMSVCRKKLEMRN
jgi:threonyl-tRNA synthetase